MLSNCSMAECFPEKSSWYQNEQDCTVLFERSNGLSTVLSYPRYILYYTSSNSIFYITSQAWIFEILLYFAMYNYKSANNIILTSHVTAMQTISGPKSTIWRFHWNLVSELFNRYGSLTYKTLLNKCYKIEWRIAGFKSHYLWSGLYSTSEHIIRF